MRSAPRRLRTAGLFVGSFVLLACVSCSPDAAPPVTPPGGSGGDTAAATFDNPGGMWMPGQMAEHAAMLRKLGLKFDPEDLSDPTAFPLGAVVSLGGCSASFVSADGLIVTNHHCVGGHLQHNSTPEANLLETGYLAKDRSEEKWGGPTRRVFVTMSSTDVTEQVLAGTVEAADDRARYEKITANQKALTAKCEEGKPATRCHVASFFEGAQYFQIEQLELRDIRLVYAPAEGIGNYGGEVDNWRWPRHVGDYSFLRAYVGPDGQPADYDLKNVPYKPPHHLKVAAQGVRAGDLVMVAGYPGRTNRLKTADEVESAASWYYPRDIARREQYIALLESITKDDSELAIKASGTIRGLNNYLTNFRGMQDGLVKGGLAKVRAAEEAKLRAWIDADAGRKQRYGTVLDDIAKLNAESRKTREQDITTGELLQGSSLLSAAFTLIEMADERPKPDAERSASFQERNWTRIEQGIEAGATTYDRRIDRPVFEMILRRAAALPAEQRPPALEIIVGKTVDEAAIAAALDKLYAKTKLESTKAYLKLLRSGSAAKLAKSKDPFVQLALALRPLQKDLEKRGETRAGAMAAVRPKYLAALREFKGGVLAPDANSTLRITYGTVRGYSPAPGQPVYRPFTTPSEMVAKHTGKDPFIAPQRLLDAVAKGAYGPYADPELGQVPLDFLADLDITGGNSGSACINASGELVGLAFDGNYESMASDWIFMPDVTRSIQVDARYMLWVMDAVDGADHLLREMGIEPSIE